MEAHLEENVELVREESGPRHHVHHPCSAFRAPATLYYMNRMDLFYKKYFEM